MSMMVSPKDRSRSNSDLQCLQTTSFRRALLVDQEFESTKLKLDILRKFEKNMLSQRTAEATRLLEELENQNALLQQIRDGLLAKSGIQISIVEDQIQEDQHLRTFDRPLLNGSFVSSLGNTLQEIQEEEAENQPPLNQQGEPLQHPPVRSKGKKTTLGEYCKSPGDFIRSKHKSSTFAAGYSFMRSSHKASSRHFDSRNTSKLSESSLNRNPNSNMRQDAQNLDKYFLAKEKEVAEKQLALLRLQKQMIQIDKIKREEQLQYKQTLDQQKQLMSQLLSSLVGSNSVTDKQIELMQKLDHLAFGEVKSVSQHFT